MFEDDFYFYVLTIIYLWNIKWYDFPKQYGMIKNQAN